MKIYTLHKNTVAYKLAGMTTGINFSNYTEFVQFRFHTSNLLGQTSSIIRARQMGILRNISWSYDREKKLRYSPHLMYFSNEGDITLALLTWKGVYYANN